MSSEAIADVFYKADKHGHHFQKKHFEWDGTTLRWRRKPGGAVRGELNLHASGASIASSFSYGSVLAKPPTKHIFAITTHERVLKLAFLSEEQRDKWYTALSEYHAKPTDSTTFPDSVELKLHVVSARNLRASDIGGTSDPYVKLRVCTARSDAARAEVLELLSEGNVGVGADQHAAFAHLAKKKLWETAAAAKTTIQHKTCQPTWNLDITVCLGLRDVLVCDVFDHDTFTSDDSLGSFVVLPEWYIPDTYDERPMAPPLGRVGFGLTRRTDWWPLFPVGKHKATGQLQLVVTNMALPTEDTTQDESKDDAMSTMSDMVVNGTSSQAVRDKMTQFRREQEAAVRLQCAWRRHVARRRVAEVRAQKAAELAEFQQQTAAALSIQAANRGRLGRAQVWKLRQEQKKAAEHKAREMVAIKLQAAWRGRQSRLRVARLRAELEEKRRETDAALTIQAAYRRKRTNRRIAERRAAMEEANRRAEAEANAMDSMRRMRARGQPPADQVAFLLAEDASLTEAEAQAMICAAMKLQCRFRCLQSRRRVTALKAQRARALAEEKAKAEAMQAAEEAAARRRAAEALATAQRKAEEEAQKEHARQAAYAARVAAAERAQAALEAKQAAELAQREAEVKAAVLIQSAWRARQARGRVEDVRAQQRRDVAQLQAAEMASAEMNQGGLRRKAKRRTAQQLIELEEEAMAAELDDLKRQLAHALRVEKKAVFLLKKKWKEVCAPIKGKQAEMRAATTASLHRAARLRWEAKNMAANLLPLVAAEKEQLLASQAEVKRIQGLIDTLRDRHNERMLALTSQAQALANKREKSRFRMRQIQRMAEPPRARVVHPPPRSCVGAFLAFILCRDEPTPYLDLGDGRKFTPKHVTRNDLSMTGNAVGRVPRKTRKPRGRAGRTVR